jgi:hypothetical protein
LPISVAVGRSVSIASRRTRRSISASTRRQLEARLAEELDAVVLERVVRGGDHDARVGAQLRVRNAIPASAAADQEDVDPIEQMPDAMAVSSM